jgi:hypothetical protein
VVKSICARVTVVRRTKRNVDAARYPTLPVGNYYYRAGSIRCMVKCDRVFLPRSEGVRYSSTACFLVAIRFILCFGIRRY